MISSKHYRKDMLTIIDTLEMMNSWGFDYSAKIIDNIKKLKRRTHPINEDLEIPTLTRPSGVPEAMSHIFEHENSKKETKKDFEYYFEKVVSKPTHILIPIEALDKGKLSRSDVNYIYNTFIRVDLSEKTITEKAAKMVKEDDENNPNDKHYPYSRDGAIFFYQRAIKDLLK